MDTLLFIIIGYALGSIPFSLLITRLAGLGDIRNIGSGNPGATNVLRTGNKFLALLTLLADGAKGAIAFFIAYKFATPELAFITGTASIVGHCFPVWLGFKGGKGVATALGVWLISLPLVGVIAIAAWLTAALIWRTSSLSALISACIAPLSAYLFSAHGWFASSVSPLWATISTALISAIVIYRHKDNITRLRTGRESTIGK